jgi:hypothetical protein
MSRPQPSEDTPHCLTSLGILRSVFRFEHCGEIGQVAAALRRLRARLSAKLFRIGRRRRELRIPVAQGSTERDQASQRRPRRRGLTDSSLRRSIGTKSAIDKNLPRLGPRIFQPLWT